MEYKLYWCVTERPFCPTLYSLISTILSLIASFSFLILAQWPLFYFVFVIILDGAFRPVFESTANISHLYVIFSIVGRYYSFIFNLPKISPFSHFISKGTERNFQSISPYVARAKSKSIKPRRKSYSVRTEERTLIPSIHSRLFESCSTFYFPLP
jgi:hypothetical protein